MLRLLMKLNIGEYANVYFGWPGILHWWSFIVDSCFYFILFYLFCGFFPHLGSADRTHLKRKLDLEFQHPEESMR